MPPKSTVLIFQDHKGMLNSMQEELEAHNHTRIGTAETIGELKVVLQQLRDKHINVDGALIDNNAPWVQGEPLEKFGSQAADMIRNALGKNVLLISTTSTSDRYGDVMYNTAEGISD